MSVSQKKVAPQTMGRSEVYLRRICQEKGVPFSPAMQQVAVHMDASHGEDEVPSLDQLFAQFGGVKAFIEKFGAGNSPSMMAVTRIKKPAPSNVANTLRETALVQQMETAKAELAKAQMELVEAKAKAASAPARLEASRRRPKGICRIAK